MKKVLCILLSVALLLLNLSGCCRDKKEETPTAKEGFQLITDCVDRTVEVPLEVQRVAALDSFAGEAMVMLGAGERMVAAPNGVKSDRLLEEICPTLPRVGVPISSGAVNAESLAALKPDLVLLKSALYRSDGEREKLEQLGIAYLVVSYESMEEQMQALSMIGKALGGQAEKTSVDINNYYNKVVDLAFELSGKIPDNERVRVYHAINEVVRTDGSHSLGNDWVSCVGCINVSSGQEREYLENDYFAGMEQIYRWDPDIIICNEVDTVTYLRKDPKWTGLCAVSEGRIYNIPVGATRWGQRGSLETFFAILWLGTTIYPEVYAQVNLKEEVTEFYQNILGVNLDDETYAAILSGSGIRNKSVSAGQ